MPLLNMYGRLRIQESITAEAWYKAMEDALVQWASAFHFTSRRRRHNVSQAGTKSMAHLLDKPETFNCKEAIKNLFGKTFEDAMVEYSKRMLTLCKAEEAEAAAAKTSGGPAGNTRYKKVNYKDRQPAQAGRGRGCGGNRGRGGANSRYVNNTSPLYLPLCAPVHPSSVEASFVGGRTRFFAAN